MKNSMATTTIVMALLAAVTLAVAYSKGKHIEGLAVAKNMIIQILPLILRLPLKRIIYSEASSPF